MPYEILNSAILNLNISKCFRHKRISLKCVNLRHPNEKETENASILFYLKFKYENEMKNLMIIKMLSKWDFEIHVVNCYCKFEGEQHERSKKYMHFHTHTHTHELQITIESLFCHYTNLKLFLFQNVGKPFIVHDNLALFFDWLF